MVTKKSLGASIVTTALLGFVALGASMPKLFAQTRPDVIVDDMGIPASLYDAITAPPTGGSNPHSTFAAVPIWTGGVVPYAFDSDVTQAHRDAFVFACMQWQVTANLHFIPRTNQSNYVQVHNQIAANAGTSDSEVGMKSGEQYIHIYHWGYPFVMAHEIGHTLGLIHEQSRSDRDSYVTINFNNIQSNATGNFQKFNNTLNKGAYDFDSIMHYFLSEYSSNGLDTISINPPYSSQWNSSNVGLLNHLSVLDKAGMAMIYGQPARFDMTGDGKDDILWQNISSGVLDSWAMHGTTTTGPDNALIASNIAPPDPNQWRVVGTGDFNKDGKMDILWQDQADGGHLVVWFMNGVNFISSQTVTQPYGTTLGPNFKVVSVNDFNSDGWPDLICQNIGTGEVSCFLMTGTTMTVANSISIMPAASAPNPSQWHIVGSADFNKDGKPDLLWQNQQDSGNLFVWLMNGSTYTGQQTSILPYGPIATNWKVVGTGDYNADGQPDLLWQDSTDSGNIIAWLMNGTTTATHVTITQPNVGLPTSWKIVGIS